MRRRKDMVVKAKAAEKRGLTKAHQKGEEKNDGQVQMKLSFD